MEQRVISRAQPRHILQIIREIFQKISAKYLDIISSKSEFGKVEQGVISGAKPHHHPS